MSTTRPPGAPYAFQSNWIILDRPLMSGAPYGASIFSRYIAASTETDEEDADVEDGCEGHAGGWDAEPGASGSGSDGDDGLEFLG